MLLTLFVSNPNVSIESITEGLQRQKQDCLFKIEAIKGRIAARKAQLEIPLTGRDEK
jgi:hypothetical protein